MGVSDGFALARSHAIVAQRKKTVRQFHETVLMRGGRVKTEQTAGINEKNFLTFSNSKEGRQNGNNWDRISEQFRTLLVWVVAYPGAIGRKRLHFTHRLFLARNFRFPFP